MIDKLIRLSVFTILLGRGYEHLFWDPPYRTFFWDEEWLLPLFNFMGWSWTDYVTSSITDTFVGLFAQVLGVILILGAISSTKYFQGHVSIFLLRISSLIMACVSLLLYKEHHYQLPMLIEHALQVGMPLLLSFQLQRPNWQGIPLQLMKVLISLTFLGHGTYALGLGLAVPANFIEMTMEILHVSEMTASRLLTIAGLWDYAIAILIFIPIGRLPALSLAATWGLATAFARTFAYVGFDNFLLDGHSWFFETTYRLCHGLIPFAVILALGGFKMPQWKWISAQNEAV